MGGTTTATQTGGNVSSPWAPTTGTLQNIIAQAGNYADARVPEAENTAMMNLSGQLIGGGGAFNNQPMINNAYSTYSNNLQGLTNPANLNPYNTPGFADALRVSQGDITKQINDQFAAAGRDLSGANVQNLARGLSQGAAGTIANQYNANVGALMGANQGLYGAGNTTANFLNQLQNQYLANQQAGINVAQQQYMQPVNNLGAYENLILPIANSGGQVTQTGINNTSPSWTQQFGQVGQGLSGLGSFLFSDERVKEDITPVGKLYDDQTVYSYRYVDDPTPRIGLLAQEVEKHHPEAVAEIGGVKAVDYDKATEDARTIGLFASLKRAA